MGGGQIDLWRAAFLGGLGKAACTQTPRITGVQADKSVFGPRRAEVIAHVFREGQNSAVITAQTVWLP